MSADYDTCGDYYPSENDFENLYKKDIKISKRKLGQGITRKVFESKTFPNLVIKIENLNYGDRYFQNVMEYFLWEQVDGTKWAKYFAPCHWVSADGTVLYMSKTESLNGRKPKGIPSFLDDAHWGNFGTIGKRIVCHDYGINELMKKGRFGAKLKKPYYW